MIDMDLVRLQVRHERARAAEQAATPTQQPLPFGDHFLDDQGRLVFAHGTAVGLRRHVTSGEPLCQPCQRFRAELFAAGYATVVDVVDQFANITTSGSGADEVNEKGATT